MQQTELKEAVVKATVKRNGKPILTCKKALLLAGKFDVTPKQIGKLCDSESIKIRQCQLGCF
ncbi:MAG: hypothetical protein WCI95_04800 [bacterium]